LGVFAMLDQSERSGDIGNFTTVEPYIPAQACAFTGTSRPAWT
jgi:hypothetical protein